NVFAGPGNIALLLPGFGARHAEIMQDCPRLGCIEVCVRDTNPGEITINRKGNPVIKKKLNREDARRRDTGMAAIRNIFNATGAEEILHGQFGIGLHLMGGLGMGASAKQGVVSPEFTLYGSQRILAADSSRSEEHTSELQSRFELVCRLLLETQNDLTPRSTEPTG